MDGPPALLTRLARRAGGRGVHDLVDALVGEAQALADLAHRAAGGVEAADCVLEVRLRPLGLVLELEEAIAGRLRLTEDLFVQCHHGV